MNLVFLDFETFWSKTHSLSKMNPLLYIASSETELISLSMAVNNEPAVCVFGESDIRALLGSVDMADAMLVAHNNSGFDSMLLSWRLGVRPAMWGCTLASRRCAPMVCAGMALEGRPRLGFDAIHRTIRAQGMGRQQRSRQ